MKDLPPILRDQRKIDADQLKLLSIFHFVAAGFSLLGVLFLLGHFAIFHAVFANPKIWESTKQAPPPAEMFAMMKWFYLIFGLWFFVSGTLSLISGLFLRKQKHWTYCIIVAAFNCLHFPIGTILGVFTIVVLIRESVKELYEQ